MTLYLFALKDVANVFSLTNNNIVDGANKVPCLFFFKEIMNKICEISFFPEIKNYNTSNFSDAFFNLLCRLL